MQDLGAFVVPYFPVLHYCSCISTVPHFSVSHFPSSMDRCHHVDVTECWLGILNSEYYSLLYSTFIDRRISVRSTVLISWFSVLFLYSNPWHTLQLFYLELLLWACF